MREPFRSKAIAYLRKRRDAGRLITLPVDRLPSESAKEQLLRYYLSQGRDKVLDNLVQVCEELEYPEGPRDAFTLLFVFESIRIFGYDYVRFPVSVWYFEEIDRYFKVDGGHRMSCLKVLCREPSATVNVRELAPSELFYRWEIRQLKADVMEWIRSGDVDLGNKAIVSR